MITRRKAALLQALPQTGTSLETAAPAKTKQGKSEGVETPGGQELVSKMQVIRLSSDSDSERDDDDDSEEGSGSDDYDEKEASAMSQCSDISAMDESSDDECASNKVDRSEVVQSAGAIKVSSPVSIDTLIAEKVHQIIKEGGDLKKLTLDYCRSYLRHHGMRISGNKPVLIDRIKQHIELKQGVPEKYRAATFTINCTGDVCKGDVIKFKQKVYKLSAAKRVGKAVGERIVVGRVVKESYGEKKQQHTFTVEVLWSAGYRPLPPMRQLLVKGRNLYRLRTYRQNWEDEKLRKISLDEKHERGAAARSKRRETLRASGPRKITVGGRKQLPNPYVAMGPNANLQPDLTGGRGGGGTGGPLHRSWFPRHSSVRGQPFVLPQRPMVPQHSGFGAVGQDANIHSDPIAGVVHNTRVQRPTPETQSASAAGPPPYRTQNGNKEGFDLSNPLSQSQSLPRFASTASKEGANFHNFSTAGVSTDTRPETPRRESKVVTKHPSAGLLEIPRVDPDSQWRRQETMKSPCRSNSAARREEASFTKRSSAGLLETPRVQLPREDNRILGSETAGSSRQVEYKSPCLSDISRLRGDASNRNVPPSAEMLHDSRASPFRFQSGVFREADPLIIRSETVYGSPWSSNLNRWRDDPNKGNIPAPRAPQDSRASPLIHQRGIVPGTYPFLERRQNENMSWRRDQNSWKEDVGFNKDSVAGVAHDVLAPSARPESRNFSRENPPHSVKAHDENRSPWRYDSNAKRRDEYHHIHHKSPAPEHTQAQLVRAQHNVSRYHSPDRRQVGNRSPGGQNSSKTSKGDVRQHNGVPGGGEHNSVPSGGQQNHVLNGGQIQQLGQPSRNENFKCPGAGCLNLGSKLCSYKVCVRCCKQKGLWCSNPKHKRAVLN